MDDTEIILHGDGGAWREDDDLHTAFDAPSAEQMRKTINAAIRHSGLIAVSATQVGEYTHVVIRKREPHE